MDQRMMLLLLYLINVVLINTYCEHISKDFFTKKIVEDKQKPYSQTSIYVWDYLNLLLEF